MLAIQCDYHPEYSGTTKPEYDCLACRALRAFCLDMSPDDVSGLVGDALACGGLRVADAAEPQGAPTHCGCCLNLVAGCPCPRAKGAPQKPEPGATTVMFDGSEVMGTPIRAQGGPLCARCGKHEANGIHYLGPGAIQSSAHRFEPVFSDEPQGAPTDAQRMGAIFARDWNKAR